MGDDDTHNGFPNLQLSGEGPKGKRGREGRKGASKEKKGVQKKIGAFAGKRLPENAVKT